MLLSVLAAVSIGLMSCVSLEPAVPLAAASRHPAEGGIVAISANGREDLIILAFSGGGARSAAFSMGVMRALGTMRAHDGAPLAHHVALVSGSSGGALPAAWFALNGADDLEAYRKAILDPDWHGELHTSPISPLNLLRLHRGGANSAQAFARNLDRLVFRGATLGETGKAGRPSLVLSATDTGSLVPFYFGQEVFAQLCTDHGSVKVADAVAASMAAPVLFRPMVIERFPAACSVELPRWVSRAEGDPSALPSVIALAGSYRRYRQRSSARFVHLLDGGLTDYLALGPVLAALQTAEHASGPLSAADAVKVRRIAIILVNVGQAPGGDADERAEAPDGQAVVEAAFAAAMAVGSRATFDELRRAVEVWEARLRSWRCALTVDAMRDLQERSKPLRCDDVQVRFDTISFAALTPQESHVLAAIKTRMSLLPAEVDLLIAGGERATVLNSTLDEMTSH
jgi:NTE family protein